MIDNGTNRRNWSDRSEAVRRTFYEEFLRDLRGKKGIETYREMAENDDTIGAILFAIEMLIRQASWTVEPAGDTPKDKEAAEFVEQCMHDMQDTWTDTISEILSFLTYGWSFHEIVYKRRMGKTSNPKTRSKYNDGLIGWRKLPIRAQETLYQLCLRMRWLWKSLMCRMIFQQVMISQGAEAL